MRSPWHVAAAAERDLTANLKRGLTEARRARRLHRVDSRLYTYDCYTQTGINNTIKPSNHWMVQAGLSAGCEASPWSPVAKLTGNVCLGYTWNTGKENVYTCANSINSGKYSYNNLAAYYATWYHRFNNSWHVATESWYQYESHTPNVNPAGLPSALAAAAPLLLTNANGAWCQSAQVTCFAPEWAVLNYAGKQVGKKGKDSLTVRNEFFDDLKGSSENANTILGAFHRVGALDREHRHLPP